MKENVKYNKPTNVLLVYILSNQLLIFDRDTKYIDEKTSHILFYSAPPIDSEQKNRVRRENTLCFVILLMLCYFMVRFECFVS